MDARRSKTNVGYACSLPFQTAPGYFYLVHTSTSNHHRQISIIVRQVKTTDHELRSKMRNLGRLEYQS